MQTGIKAGRSSVQNNLRLYLKKAAPEGLLFLCPQSGITKSSHGAFTGLYLIQYWWVSLSAAYGDNPRDILVNAWVFKMAMNLCRRHNLFVEIKESRFAPAEQPL
ncbi:MAG: hypothetical protein ABIQ31_00825 [Ferruginibacter sp.]